MIPMHWQIIATVQRSIERMLLKDIFSFWNITPTMIDNNIDAEVIIVNCAAAFMRDARRLDV